LAFGKLSISAGKDKFSISFNNHQT